MAYTDAQLKVMSDMIYTGIVENSNLPFLANTKWQAAAESATEVTIISTGDVTFADVVRGTQITPQEPAAGTRVLKIDQVKGFAVPSYDVDRLVSGYVQAVAQKAAKAAALLPEAYILAMATKANFATNWIAGSADAVIEVNGSNIGTYLRMMNTKLSKQGVPKDQRFVALTPELYEKVLIAIEKKNVAGQATQDALFGGSVMKVCGLNIIETNQYVVTNDSCKVFYGHVNAIAAAYLPIQVESQRMTLQFGDNLMGQVQYGAKVVDEKVGGAAYLKVIAEA